MCAMLKIDGQRLWASLMEMAKVGGTPAGGCRRLALTKEDAAGRALFSQWCVAAGMTVSVDRIGNLFARRAGLDDDAPAVASGSHLDTQPEGGRFDGVYGVLAALEVVRTLNDANIRTRKPIEIVVWTNEEGARFTPAMLGSATFTGAIPLETALQTRDAANVTVADALSATGYDGARAVPGIAFDAYFEAHIEQGPVLEESGIPIGVVTGGQAIRWLDVRVRGQAAHAGTTPMKYRRDALFASADMASALEHLAKDFAPRGLVTIGEWHIRNASRNTIAADLTFTVDLRHPDDAQIASMHALLCERFEAIAAKRGLSVEISPHWISPSTPFDPACITAVAEAVQALGYPNQRIVSGAGHDAINLAKYCPTAMIFIPCVDGLSHNEAEDALPEDVSRGADVLLHAMLSRAGQVKH
ncbi:Zn-dependent hydrolase [Paraburkholderia sp.]|uniref:Zn-dependent hydrolase n=1 Tax=Paraburkholderia sp. TaxID=1926495 RepID=UPI002386C594|nr:Zn-dependent hydrolase [Paraburkholderia sp.]MDE1179021.1 Zn-dependent hydrolase [Paraburkholderia sp.]